MRHATLFLAVAALAAADLGAGATLAAPDVCGAIDVRLDEDSCGRVISASATGNARGDACDMAWVHRVAASGSGSASNAAGDHACGNTLAIGASP